LDDNSFNCMGFTPTEQAIFVVQNLGPTLQNNGFEEIKILMFDDQRPYLPIWVETVRHYFLKFYLRKSQANVYFPK
jgi:hypothetical protein